MKECNQCSLCQLSDPTCIMGSGPKEAEIMVINSYATDLDEENEVGISKILTTVGNYIF